MQSHHLLVLALTLCLCFSLIEGPKVVSLGQQPFEMTMSGDGSMVVVTYQFVKEVEVYTKTNDTFVYDQSLPDTLESFNVAISASNDIIIDQGKYTMKYFRKDPNGHYQLMQMLLYGSQIQDIEICTTGLFVVFSTLNGIYLHRKISGQYVLVVQFQNPPHNPLEIAFDKTC